ncbi:DUF2799 domain-containing protein [Vibrio cincinnatiensis]|uniref:DUF2799 domain-containing protein n=1 Tax=Vibrio cincinnatiensis TaxID=675 RepID=UPI001EDF19C0|nr:DUF2799 domain-containing protein [Vibrio cincinnatiensis]MCG3730059.1 DUF2799 domain-containing protein [Vibrio cincinnatiensis]
MSRVIVVGIIFVLMGCVASENDLAEQGNWHQIGYNDGIAGYTSRSYQALSELGPVKHNDYESGYLEGIAEYCNPNFAYQMGVNGQYYEGVCEGTDQAQKFRMEWQRGWNEYNR